MAKEKGGDQTETPTAKRLKDARKDGEAHKSRELTGTAMVLAALLLAWLATQSLGERLGALILRTTEAIRHPDLATLKSMSVLAAYTLVVSVLPLLLTIAAVAVLVDFLQVGAIFAPKRVAPKMERMNPAEGIKKMFSQEHLVEVVKAVLKTAAIVGIFWLVLRSMLPQLLGLPQAPVAAVGVAHWKVLQWVGGWVVFVFLFVSVLDAVYQRFAFIKNLKMSRRDIRQELKDNEGDPLVKSRRRQLHQEWSQNNLMEAVRRASVVVTNPTHLAVALMYEDGKTDLPVVTAKGEDYEARLIRETAEQAGVPVMQNVDLARALYAQIPLDQYITSEFFEAVAELLQWAEGIRREREG
jgi:type III secretion protein U